MKNFWLILMVFLSFGASAQKGVTVKYLDTQPIIDGELNEDFWQEITPASDFWQYFPVDSTKAKAQTEIFMASDDNNLYIGIKCYSEGKDYVVPSLKRDYRAGGNDNITLMFDSFNDRTNAFIFGINPYGVIREGLVTNGGQRREDFTVAWDNKWRGEAKIFDGYYSAELEIPFSTLRFKEGNTEWGMHAYRFDTQSNESSVWHRINRGQVLFSVAFAGDMNWEKAPESSGSNISVIPYISSNYSKDYENGTPSDFGGSIGGDMKVGVSSGLNLDLTVNPDFAQVEVDRQVTNIDRFEIFFPERRQFFLENADLFGGFGFSSTNPFFSRRIGVGVDTSSNTTIQNRIIGGARLSGKVNNDLRIGLLTMQTGQETSQGVPSTNYTVAVAQHKLWKRSNIGIIAVNRQTGEDGAQLIDEYNRVVGLDFNYASADNTWTGKTFLHSSFSPEQSSAQVAHGLRAAYTTRTLNVGWEHEVVQNDYNALVGFVRRTDFFRIAPNLEFSSYPTTGKFAEFSYGVESTIFSRPNIGVTDQQTEFRFGGQLRNQSRFRFGPTYNYILLTDGFDPTGTSSEELEANSDYKYWAFEGFYSSDPRKDFNFRATGYVGEYFNGTRLGLRGGFTLRFQPKAIIGLNYAYNYFDMPHLDGKRETFLIGPRLDYTFNKELFFTLFVQYNSQSKNTNINGRFQWRFAPVSDFFLVYTDNYATGNIDEPSNRFAFDVRNRSIVAKLTYWLNI